MMRLRTLVAVILAATPALLHAQTPTDLKAGRTLVTSDGKRVGQIDRIVADQSGDPRSVAVILGSRFIYVPASTLSSGDNGRVMTSLTYKDVRKLP